MNKINEKTYGLKSHLLFGLMLHLASAVCAQSVGVFEGHSDVGTDVKRGAATYHSKTQQYEVAGAGYRD